VVAILTEGEVKVESAALVFAEKEPLGYVSDTSDCASGCP
jgi:hypothetical protein